MISKLLRTPPRQPDPAQLDFLGAHTYQRVDKDGIFHTPGLERVISKHVLYFDEVCKASNCLNLNFL